MDTLFYGLNERVIGFAEVMFAIALSTPGCLDNFVKSLRLSMLAELISTTLKQMTRETSVRSCWQMRVYLPIFIQ